MEIKKEIIEWKMIRPDGSERILHIGKNEVNSRELDFYSNNSLILFEIYFSPNLKPYLRFYGYTPLRLNLEKIGENSKHIYIDNNQSFMFLEQLENTTIDVYDKEEFVTFSFQKIIKKPENNKDIIEKNKRMKWLNENIEYEDLKKEENEYGNKSLYSKDFFNYNKKNQKKDEDYLNKSDDIMSNFSQDKNDTIKALKENLDENIKEQEQEKDKELITKSKKSEESSEHHSLKNESENNEISEQSDNDIKKLKTKEEKEEEENSENNSEEKNKSMDIEEKEQNENINKNEDEDENEKEIKNENKSSSKKSLISRKSSDKKSSISKKSVKESIKSDNKKSKSKSTNSEKASIEKSISKSYSNEEKENSKQKSDEKKNSNLLNYDKILDNFVLSNSDSESKMDSNDKEEIEEFSEKSENENNENKIQLENLNIKKDGSFNLNKKEKLNSSIQTKCTICLDQMTNPATLKPCGHQFCKECIAKWLQKSSACPDCKKNGKKLYFFSSKNGRYMAKKIKRKKYKAEKQNYEDWFLNCDKTCLICGKEDNTAYLLVCDSCNFRICHTFCVGLDSIPDAEWHCPECEAKEKGKNFSLSKSNLKKFKEKEKKILKVKQSEVKGGKNISKINSNNTNTSNNSENKEENKKNKNENNKSQSKNKNKSKNNKLEIPTGMNLRKRSSDISNSNNNSNNIKINDKNKNKNKKNEIKEKEKENKNKTKPKNKK